MGDEAFDAGDEEIAVADQVRRQFFGREMDALTSVNGRAMQALREDLTALRQENNEVCAKISEVEFAKFTLEQERD